MTEMNKKASEQDLKQLAQESIDPSWPKASEVWRHYKGGLYDIVALAVHESELTYLVIYRSQEKGYIWARPISNWFEQVETTNGKVQRFVREVQNHAQSVCSKCRGTGGLLYERGLIVSVCDHCKGTKIEP